MISKAKDPIIGNAISMEYHFDTFSLYLFSFFLNKKKIVSCSENSDGSNDAWENIHMICPNQCVCQHAPFMDLSVARWIQGLRREEVDPSKRIDDTPYSDMIFNEVINFHTFSPRRSKHE